MPLDDLALYQADNVVRIMRTAVRKARAESRRLGVPNVQSLSGVIYYEFPNGDVRRHDELPPDVDYFPKSFSQ